MASFGQTRAAANAAVFSSVFPKDRYPQPKQGKHFKLSHRLGISSVESQLTNDSRLCLGIGVENDGSQFFEVTGFNPYFPVDQVHGSGIASGDGDTLRYHKELTKTKSWSFMPSWRAEFGVARLEKSFAAVIDNLLTEFITWSYAGSFERTAVNHLRSWVDRIMWPYVSSVLTHLHAQKSATMLALAQVQLQRWREMALTRLADLRISELFEVIVDWDSTGSVIDDLKCFTTSTATRSYLTADFSSLLSRRLLHPGASTIEILQVYISIIKAFRKLDAKGVLLERVARKVRRYLRERDDTVRVVVAGLLADLPQGDAQNEPDVLSELAIELQSRGSGDDRDSDGDLDWNNMEWLPDPVDAAPDYMKSKSTDVIGSLITLFESKDVLVKELQTMLADRLLQDKLDFDQEIGVVEHLKIRFGDSALQGCEVMLRDVLDSRKVDQVIRRDLRKDHSSGAEKAKHEHSPEVHAKILSRLFWPSLQEQTFNVPHTIREQQLEYEKGFESLKQSRKLTWLNAIGQVEVHLELEDRIFEENVLPWQASVIYAFQDKPTHTISSLESELDMTPALVRSACLFWAAKRVLAGVPGQRDTFHVIEKLPKGVNSDGGMSVANDSAAVASQSNIAAAAAEAAAMQAAREAEEQERKLKMAMYHQFIISMLTNQGAMPLPRISMMLGIVVPGGFPFGNEELREFLGGMVKEGVLEVGAGGAYKVR